MDGYSKDIVKEDIEKLKSIFPQCVVEGKVKIDKLLSILGEYDEKEFEKYEFTWKGKNECYKTARTRTKATLIPCESESVNFNDTNNIYIEGDNLEVLKILQHSYYNKIKMIYIDPPYNTGNDFVYKDDFRDSLANYKNIVSSLGKSNPETSGRFHTDWLNMMFPRLMLAHTLLKDDGVIFISIDDNEVDNLKKMCNEVFGEENFIGIITWGKKRKGSFLSKNIVSLTEYVLVYAKNIKNLKGIYGGQASNNESQPIIKRTNKLSILEIPENIIQTKLEDGIYNKGIYGDELNPVELLNDVIVENGKIINKFSIKAPFVWSQENFNNQLQKGCKFVINTINFQIRVFKVFDIDDFKGFSSYINGIEIKGTNEDAYEELENLFNIKKLFDYSKPSNYIKMLVDAGCHFEKDDIILDFFSGSATTAHAVMQLNAEDGGNRKYIMVQLPELCSEKTEAYKAGYKNICEIGKERIRRAGAKIKEEMENTENLDIGFRVFKLEDSNFKKWNVSLTDEFNIAKLLSDTNEIIDGRTEIDAMFEILIKNGFPLTEKIYSLDIDGYNFYHIGEECFVMVSFEKNIPIDIIEKVIEYLPAKLILTMGAFKDTSDIITAKHIINKDYSIQIEILGENEV